MEVAGRARKLRTFAIGGLVGAAGAVATVRRASRRSRRPRNSPAGLAASRTRPASSRSSARRRSATARAAAIPSQARRSLVAVHHEVGGRGHPQLPRLPGAEFEPEPGGNPPVEERQHSGRDLCTFVGVCQYGWITSSGVRELSTYGAPGRSRSQRRLPITIAAGPPRVT